MNDFAFLDRDPKPRPDNDRYAEVFADGIERNARLICICAENLARYAKLLATTPPVEVDCSDVFTEAETQLKAALLALLLSKSQYDQFISRRTSQAAE